MKRIIFFVVFLFVAQAVLFSAFASQDDLKKARELNNSQTYDSLYVVPSLQALYYQNKQIIEVMENINKNLAELLELLKKKN